MQGQKYPVNELSALCFLALLWHCCGVPNSKPRFNSFSDRCLKVNQAIHSFTHSFIHFALVSLDVSSLIYLERLQMHHPRSPQPHWGNYPLYMTMNRSLCVRCLFISWSQVYVIDYQTKMTMVDSSGAMSRPIQCQVVKLTGSVQGQHLPFSVLKLSFWQRHDLRNIPGIISILLWAVA